MGSTLRKPGQLLLAGLMVALLMPGEAARAAVPSSLGVLAGCYGAGSHIQFLGQPTRVLDTRSGPGVVGIRPDGSRTTVPTAQYITGAVAAIGNITVTDTGRPGFLTLFAGGSLPLASSLNYGVGSTVGNHVQVALASDGSFQIYNAGPTNLVFDLTGGVFSDSRVLRLLDSPAETCRAGETPVSWNQIGQQGPTGLTGATGPSGPQGLKGDTGAIGAQGPQGVKGDTGAIGPQGATGPSGAPGSLGPTGPMGATGAQGATGLQGLKGDKGDPGVQGLQGPIGASGPVGPSGPAGAQGATGATGSQGSTGAQGPPGIVGSLEQLGSIPCVRNGTSGLTTVSIGPDAYARIRCVVPTTLTLSPSTISCNLYVGSCGSATATVTNFVGNASVNLSYPPWSSGPLESSTVVTDPSGSGSGAIPNMLGACAFTFFGSSATNVVSVRADDPSGLPAATAPLTVVCLRGQ